MVIKVKQHEFVSSRCDEAITEGAGPCVVVAIAYVDLAYLLHSPDPRMDGTLDEMRAALEQVPRNVRPMIHPFLSGGAPSTCLREDMRYSREVRASVMEAVRDLGFGTPHEHWMEVGQYVGVRLRPATGTVITDVYRLTRRAEREFVRTLERNVHLPP